MNDSVFMMMKFYMYEYLCGGEGLGKTKYPLEEKSRKNLSILFFLLLWGDNYLYSKLSLELQSQIANTFIIIIIYLKFFLDL